MEYYQKQPEKNSERKVDRVIPLVADFNLGLPKIGKIKDSQLLKTHTKTAP